MTAASMALAISATSYAQDDVAPGNPPANGAPTAPQQGQGGKNHFKKKLRRAVRFGICVGEQLGKAGETLAPPVKGETPDQKKARQEANKELIKQAAQAGNCIKKKPKPTEE